MEKDTYLMLMHISQLAGVFIPGAGFIIPVVLWALHRDQSVEVDRHGKVILNWMISALIYSMICVVLMFVLIGFLGLFVLLLVNIIFVIVGTVNASEGKLWRYPLSIQFFRIDNP
ncbi:DUF4870 domain-containing protein [Microbulbifer flavimaris]|uniref:DUF4870 domain-containing protein n=2 Tax=Microbulbiferaceae TaxID=1706373 RepID=A0ABX4HYT2_9GAMM|nr:hypothetical protein AVO43_12750 [Microbulbifer sp. ZGT114]PCO04862.1 DUF4870 domain-containing protein [Microbulbifer flavimaris]